MKVAKIFLVFVILFSLSSGCIEESNIREENDIQNEPNEEFDSFENFSVAKENLNTPTEVIDYMENNFIFGFREGDGVTSYYPEELFLNKTGDCKDFATFFSYILDYHGYYAEMVVFNWYNDSNIRFGHVVTIFEDGDGFLKYQSNFDIFGPIESTAYLLNNEKNRLQASRIGAYYIIPAGSINCTNPVE